MARTFEILIPIINEMIDEDPILSFRYQMYKDYESKSSDEAALSIFTYYIETDTFRLQDYISRCKQYQEQPS